MLFAPDLHSRVALILKFSVPNSDYINANYIRVSVCCHCYYVLALPKPIPVSMVFICTVGFLLLPIVTGSLDANAAHLLDLCYATGHETGLRIIYSTATGISRHTYTPNIVYKAFDLQRYCFLSVPPPPLSLSLSLSHTLSLSLSHTHPPFLSFYTYRVTEVKQRPTLRRRALSTGL